MRKYEKSLLGFICSVLHASGFGVFFFFFFFFFSFAKASMVFYERRSKAGRLTEIMYGSLTKCLGMGPTKRWKYLSDVK